MQLLVNIDVDDIERGIAFYTRALDLTLGRRLGATGVELLGGSSPIYLLHKPAGTAPSALTTERRHYQRHWCPVHLDFVVDDLAAAVDRAVAAGATLEQPVLHATWGHLALCADPFGHGLCLLQFAGRGYDELIAHDHTGPAGAPA